MVQRTEHRHQVKHVVRAAPVGQWHHDQLVDPVGQQGTKLLDTSLVGPIPESSNERSFVEPCDVPALQPAIVFDGSKNGNSKARVCFPPAPAARLPCRAFPSGRESRRPDR